MKHFAKTALVSLMLVLMLADGAYASSKVVDRAVEIISTMESSGSYGIAANDSNGSPSVGILQWNNTRAVDLLQRIIADNPDSAKTLLGEPLYEEIEASASDGWSAKALDASQLKAVGKLLGSDSGVKVQKDQALSDVASYINKARSLGIVNAGALVYYADLAHQAGTGGVRKYAALAAEATGGYDKITLKSMYDAALQISTSFKTRRKRVYESLVKSPPKDEGTPPESLRINSAAEQILGIQDTKLMTAVFTPVDSVAGITWSSSDPKIATVDGGIITPKSLGTTTITAKTSNGLTASVQLTVALVTPTASPTPGPTPSPAPGPAVKP